MTARRSSTVDSRDRTGSHLIRPGSTAAAVRLSSVVRGSSAPAEALPSGRTAVSLALRSSPAAFDQPRSPMTSSGASAARRSRVERTSHTAVSTIAAPRASRRTTSTSVVDPVDPASPATGEVPATATAPPIIAGSAGGTLRSRCPTCSGCSAPSACAPGSLYLAYRIEPHWVAKDGRRFLTTAEQIDRFGDSVGRRREVRGAFLQDGGLCCRGAASCARRTASGAFGPSRLGHRAARRCTSCSPCLPTPTATCSPCACRPRAGWSSCSMR